MIEFKIPDMSCGHCVSVVTRAVRQLDPQARVDIDLASRTAKVESAADRQALAEALDEAGYPVA